MHSGTETTRRSKSVSAQQDLITQGPPLLGHSLFQMSVFEPLLNTPPSSNLKRSGPFKEQLIVSLASSTVIYLHVEWIIQASLNHEGGNSRRDECGSASAGGWSLIRAEQITQKLTDKTDECSRVNTSPRRKANVWHVKAHFCACPHKLRLDMNTWHFVPETSP